MKYECNKCGKKLNDILEQVMHIIHDCPAWIENSRRRSLNHNSLFNNF